METGEVTVAPMAPPPGPWANWGTQADACGWDYANRQAENIASRPKAGRNRSVTAIARSSFPSIIAEVFHNRYHIKWWKEHFNEAQENNDDGGYDDPNRNGVKAVLVGKDEIWNEDWRAKTQYVYEVDLVNHRIRFLGTFTKADAKMIQMPDGRTVGLVLRSQLH